MFAEDEPEVASRWVILSEELRVATLFSVGPSPFGCLSWLEYLRLRALVLLQTLALYKPFTYLLSILASCFLSSIRLGSDCSFGQFVSDRCLCMSVSLSFVHDHSYERICMKFGV